MKKILFWLFGACCLCFLVSCAATPPLPPMYSFSKDAIKIHIQADPQLNLNQGTPHTLLICVHQLNNPNALYRLTSDTSGIYKLLECSQFDSSVTHSKRIIVQPDQQVTYTINRAEETKYVSIVAGYYNIKKDEVVRVFDIPVVTRSLGIFSGSKIAVPNLLDIYLNLGPTKIKDKVE